MIIFQKLLLVKEMIAQLFVYEIIIMLINTTKMIAIDLNKQQALDADPKAIQQINFTGNLARDGNANSRMFLTVKEAKQTILDFSQGTVQVL